MAWIGRLGRFGMVAQGVVYTIVALLAIGFALGLGGRPTDQGGAFQTLAGEWYGAVALGLLAVGLAGYALWRFTVAALGEKVESVEDVGLGKRIAYFARGLAYAVLCYSATSRIMGADGSNGGGSDEQQAANTVFDYPGGRWLVGVVGIGLVVYGLWNGYRSLTKHFEQDLKTERMTVEEERLVSGLFGRAGFAARGIVIGLIGAFLVQAAVQHDPRDAVGLDGALQELAQQPHGRVLLALVGAGLLAYGLFGFARARYRRV
jgi:Domain of Unknown Function (DUF1206)